VITNNLTLIGGLFVLGVVIVLCIWLLTKLFPQNTDFQPVPGRTSHAKALLETARHHRQRSGTRKTNADNLQKHRKE
jgi:hypothetical protein